jgi:hypothetical protein
MALCRTEPMDMICRCGRLLHFVPRCILDELQSSVMGRQTMLVTGEQTRAFR